jgi:hypothetical protein
MAVAIATTLMSRMTSSIGLELLTNQLNHVGHGKQLSLNDDQLHSLKSLALTTQPMKYFTVYTLNVQLSQQLLQQLSLNNSKD